MTEQVQMNSNIFFEQVIAEEAEILRMRSERQKQIRALEKQIEDLQKDPEYSHGNRNYCKFSNGYHCLFMGTCNHKNQGDLDLNRDSRFKFEVRCEVYNHARDALVGKKS